MSVELALQCISGRSKSGKGGVCLEVLCILIFERFYLKLLRVSLILKSCLKLRIQRIECASSQVLMKLQACMLDGGYLTP